MRKAMMLLTLATLFGGCQSMPTWLLEAHVSAYNALHPAEETPQPGLISPEE